MSAARIRAMTSAMRRAPPLLAAPLLALLTLAAPAASAPVKLEAKRAAVLDALASCRKETADAQRLACFDKAVAALDEAEAKGQVVVVDREQVAQVKRQAFGFSLPALSFFSARGAPEEKMDRVSYTLDHAGRAGNGAWVLTTTEGPVWVQTDVTETLTGDPHKGSTLAVRHAALSSYFCNVDGQRAIRCNRQH